MIITWKRASISYAIWYLITFSTGYFFYAYSLYHSWYPLRRLKSYFIAFRNCNFRYQELVAQYGVQGIDHECAVRFNEFFGDFFVVLIIPWFFHVLVAALLFILLERFISKSYSSVYLLLRLLALFLILMPISGFIFLALIIFVMDYRDPSVFAGEGGMGIGLLGGLEIVHLIFAIVIGIIIGWLMIISRSSNLRDSSLIK